MCTRFDSEVNSHTSTPRDNTIQNIVELYPLECKLLITVR